MSDWRTEAGDFFAYLEEGVIVGAGAARNKIERLPDLKDLSSSSEPSLPPPPPRGLLASIANRHAAPDEKDDDDDLLRLRGLQPGRG